MNTKVLRALIKERDAQAKDMGYRYDELVKGNRWAAGLINHGNSYYLGAINTCYHLGLISKAAWERLTDSWCDLTFTFRRAAWEAKR